jgi:hypothetical protein
VRVFENRVLRRIFRPKRDEVTEDMRRLHNDELYHSGDHIEKNEMDGVCSMQGRHERNIQVFCEET